MAATGIGQTAVHTTTLAAEGTARLADQQDAELIAAIAQGDTAALEQLYDRYAAIIHRLALRIVHNPELAEEIVQEVFLRAWRRSASFERERGRVAQWLFGIAHNLCIDELRRQRARPVAIYEDSETPFLQQLPDERTDVASTAAARENRSLLIDVLQQLPAEQRQAIELAYFGGLSHQEIAQRLDRPLGTIKTRVRLGLQKLKLMLSARGLQSSDAF
jgi:RNA polymerase sigma-70 factor (ECF subfamily)